MSEIQCVSVARHILGEGPLWCAAEERLYWFDIHGRRLAWLAPGAAEGGFDLPMRASAACVRAKGGLMLATEAGLARFNTGSGELELVQPMDFGRGFRTNDGKIDVAGRFWWSTMDDNGGRRPGTVYRTDPDGFTTPVLEGLHIPNTLSCSPAGDVLYLADSARQVLNAYPMDDQGELGAPRALVDLSGEQGAPDGSAVDEEGFIWNAQWGAWRVVRYAPDGRIDRVAPMPVEQPSSCAFGGPDLATLYVTSAREGLSPATLAEQPMAGALLAFEPGVRGLALPAFAG
jgi:sugar lactone lactonase YvrE